MADAAEQRAKARIGTVIRGKYRIESLLATGSMACVYAATHRNASRVALKVLHPHLARDPAMRERFRREGYFANTIEHPGVPRAIDDDETEDGCAYIVMELLEGETLDQRRLRMGGKLPLPFVLTVADTVLDILGAAHDKKILHRDLKPDNVFVTFGGQVKLLDFGVARWDDGQSSSEMTAAGMVVGTPAFMPPEQALGKRESVDAQSDIWAFGATLFLAISGQTVHAGGDAKARLIATARTPARKLQDVAQFVPRGVAGVIDRALAFEKKDRWPDAHAMREALRWARRSLDAFALDSESEGQLHRRPSMFPGPPSTTRGGYQEEVTRRGFSLDEIGATLPGGNLGAATLPGGATLPGRLPGGDDEPEEDEPTLTRQLNEGERDVVTSAPSITREVPGPFGLDASGSGPATLPGSSRDVATSAPIFSLRRAKATDGESDGEAGPTTEPQLRAAPPSNPPVDARPTVPASAREDARGGPRPRFAGPTEAMRTLPMAPPVEVGPAPGPTAPPPGASAPPPPAYSIEIPTPAITTRSGEPPATPVYAHHANSGSAPPPAASASVTPAPALHRPATFGSLPPLASPAGTSQPPAPESHARPSAAPGPVLSTLVAPSRGGVVRTLGSVLVGFAVLAGATLAIVRQQRHRQAVAGQLDVPPAVAAPLPPSAAPPASSVAATPATPPVAAPGASIGASAAAPATTAAAPSASAPPPASVALAPAAPAETAKARPRPKRPPVRPATTAATAATASASTGPATSADPTPVEPTAPSANAPAAPATTPAPVEPAPKPPATDPPPVVPKPVEDPPATRAD